jgi:hypothetical protein
MTVLVIFQPDTLPRLGSNLFGIVIPLFVFVFSFVVTWLLYRHFSRKPDKE